MLFFRGFVRPMSFCVMDGRTDADLINYIITRVHEPSKMTANYETCVMANFLSKTLLNRNKK